MRTAPARETDAVGHLSASRCWALLRTAEVGRLAVVVEGRPEVFPVTFVVDRGSVVFRTAAGTKLAAAHLQRVAVEADGEEVTTGRVWSVVVKGVAHRVRGLRGIVDILDLPLETWHPGAAPTFVRVEPDEVSGRTFVAHRPAPAP